VHYAIKLAEEVINYPKHTSAMRSQATTGNATTCSC